MADVFNVSVDYLLGRTLVKENIDTVAAHRKNPHEELPEEAQEQLNDYIEFLLNKYKKINHMMSSLFFCSFNIT